MTVYLFVFVRCNFVPALYCKQLNPLNAKLNPICHLLALLGGATIVVVSRLRVKLTHDPQQNRLYHTPQSLSLTAVFMQ